MNVGDNVKVIRDLILETGGLGGEHLGSTGKIIFFDDPFWLVDIDNNLIAFSDVELEIIETIDSLDSDIKVS